MVNPFHLHLELMLIPFSLVRQHSLTLENNKNIILEYIFMGWYQVYNFYVFYGYMTDFLQVMGG